MYEPQIGASTIAPTTTASGSTPVGTTAAIPPHSLGAFGLFLRLPGYAEVLLREHKKAQFLLRLVLGVTDDGDGGELDDFVVWKRSCVKFYDMFLNIPAFVLSL